MLTSTSFAARRGDEVDASQEMIGIGAANAFAGLFQGFPVSTSGSRTAVAEQGGAKSQVTGLVCAALVAIMLLFLPGLLANLPNATLAAIVIAAALSQMDIATVLTFLRVRMSAFMLAMTATLGVVFFGVLEGILIAVALSILAFFSRLVSGSGAGWVVVQCEAITDIDVTAADMLERLDNELNDRGVRIVFVELRSRLHDLVTRYGLLKTLDRRHFYDSIDDALADIARPNRSGSPRGAHTSHPREQRAD